ncbi:hypothetical protein MNBD_GAMMA16-93 [hydrothermal vent metagenome]|uniref:DUF3817 domain-containing protein n=1 Tax=hydrothermal vent metagenome TaxID=652676 RepID=A0A3B0ZYT9_9ZZZZ
MISKFRLISLAEGGSFLLLLLVAMPLKYGMDLPLAVTIMGWVHGILFIAYLYFALGCSAKYNWSERFTVLTVLAGVTPFACFFLDKHLRQETQNA